MTEGETFGLGRDSCYVVRRVGFLGLILILEAFCDISEFGGQVGATPAPETRDVSLQHLREQTILRNASSDLLHPCQSITNTRFSCARLNAPKLHFQRHSFSHASTTNMALLAIREAMDRQSWSQIHAA